MDLTLTNFLISVKSFHPHDNKSETAKKRGKTNTTYSRINKKRLIWTKSGRKTPLTYLKIASVRNFVKSFSHLNMRVGIAKKKSKNNRNILEIIFSET